MDVEKARESFANLHCAYMGDDSREIKDMEQKWEDTKVEWSGQESLLRSLVIDWYNREVISKAK